jgi:hypothetical protein
VKNAALLLFGCVVWASSAGLTEAQESYPPQALLDRITAQGTRAHMEFLADDLLEGRGTGTRGYQLAANYIRAQFEQMGLEPAGENGGYFQGINFFIRSDQYSFVKHGIPALAISEGFKTVDPALDGKQIAVTWIKTIYHTPQDDMNQPLNFNAARRCTQVILAVGYEIAEAPGRPSWNKGDMLYLPYKVTKSNLDFWAGFEVLYGQRVCWSPYWVCEAKRS